MTTPVRVVQRAGWTVVTDACPGRTTTTIAWGLPVGARDEPWWTPAGLTHLLEHLAFHDPHGDPSESIDRRMDVLGAEVNAETWHEGVAFHATVTPDGAVDAARALATTVWPDVRRRVVARERRIVIEEIREAERDPGERAAVEAARLALGGHPLSRRIAGTAAGVGAVPRLALAWWRDVLLQHPGRTVCVAGPADLEHVARAFTDAARDVLDRASVRSSSRLVRNRRQRARSVPRAWGPRRRDVATDDVERAHVAWLRPGVGASDSRRWVADVVAAVLGDVNVGVLRPLWVETGAVDDVSVAHEAWDGAGAFAGEVVCDDDAVDVLVEAIPTLWTAVLPEALTSNRWEVATSLVAFDLRMALESTEAIALHHLETALQGRHPMDLASDAATIEALPRSSAEALVRDMADATRHRGDAVVVLRPA